MSAATKESIGTAAMALCGLEGPGAVTRRRVAELAGCSKRAVSRHYANRDALLEEVIERARHVLGTALERVLQEDLPDALARLNRAFVLISGAARTEPAIAALLTTNGDGPIGAALDHLRDAPRALARELIREAKEQSTLSANLSTAGSADAWATMLLGSIAGGLEEPATRSLFAFWRAGLSALEGPEPENAPVAGAVVSGTKHIRVLDVRPILASGRDPLGDIAPVLEALKPDELLVLLAPFRPNPLVTLMAKKGLRADTEQLNENCWSIEITHETQIEDLRELETPGPLERVLTREGSLEHGEILMARLPRYPRMLIGHLEGRGVEFELWPRPDSASLLWMRRRP